MKEFEVVFLSKPEGKERITNQAVLRVLPFSSKSVNGKTYLVSQADISVGTNAGTPRKGAGLIFDRENGREYALAVDDFLLFMDTGDLSLLPKELTPPGKAGALQLRERS
jgi:hypothetical protein